MADEDIKKTEEGVEGQSTHEHQLESGTYEIIKNRLTQHGKNLKQKLDQLNASRKDVFGSIETTLLGSERIITRHNCIPRDMVPIGDKFIFGYNVHMGLKSSMKLEDVFSVYQYKEKEFKELDHQLIGNEQFKKDFLELYKYYKLTTFQQFYVMEPYLYMVFQVGKTVDDIKAFKWILQEESLEYQDNRSDHEIKMLPQHDFEWTRTRREDHRYGIHPHISIEDRVFVETVGGDLTIKVEDNTESGMGIYAEDVDNPDQTLDDADTFYASIGNLILLKMRPYQEENYRYFVFNEKMEQVNRMDAIKDSCIFLPDDHGLIFPNGYYLQSGEYKTFDTQLTGMKFLQRIASSNGEDFQYIFYNPENGAYLILSYNLIAQTVAPPIICNGLSHFENGEMLLFKTEDEARKNHVIQIWQTPFVGRDFVTEAVSDSLLFKLGNQEVVRCMAQCQSVINLIRKEEGYVNLYVDIEKESSDIMDTYFWVDKEEAFHIKDVLAEVRTTAASAVEEYEKVTRIKNATKRQIGEVRQTSDKLFKEISYATYTAVNDYVEALAQLRVLRGEIISLRDLRYTDLPFIESLEEQVKEKNEVLSGKTVEFLLQPEGLDPYRIKVDEQSNQVPEVQKGSEGKQLDEEMSNTSDQLELLIDIVSNLKIDDPTQTTEIIDRISTIYATLNQAKGKLQNRMKDLRRVEGEAEFNSQIKLINQAVVNYLGVVDTPEKCEEYLSKVMVQLEELEGKFADFEEFIPQLTEKREELYSAFESKKLGILEQRNKKATALQKAADRILNGLQNRLKTFKTVSEINGYFAGDLMVEKVRDIVDQLLGIGDTVKADDIQSRIKTIREDAVRQLKDKQDLFVEGDNIIKFGNHMFTVNTQTLDLSMVQRDETMFFHMTGTDFWMPVDSEELENLRHVWNLQSQSESPDVYRAQYLAFKILEASISGEIESMDQLDALPQEELDLFVQKFMAPRYSENYTKGLHDQDGSKILKALITQHRSIDLLTFGPTVRALASLYWHKGNGGDMRQRIHTRLKGLNIVNEVFKTGSRLDQFLMQVETELDTFVTHNGLFDIEIIPDAARYLCREMMRGDKFIISSEAADLYQGFIQSLKERSADVRFSHCLNDLADDLNGAFYLILEWLNAYFMEDGIIDELETMFVGEVAVLLLTDSFDLKNVITVKTSVLIEGLNGDHAIMEKGSFRLAYSPFMDKLRSHDSKIVPQFHRYHELKKNLTHELKAKLRLEEFKSRVLSSFVRNKLIDKVYLPLIGDNLAKQIGVAGEGKRTDLMGMLLLISPPGYGKTTLMEYIANRLGLIFVKVNGPAVGHQVTSLDPAETSNTAARQELMKLNLALEMGNNIMVYVDDIQHCNPEFLQKFISLCDAQRKIEGIFNGVARTYDLRGKKVAVVMAGNPYTESGEKFNIPDMLANRADVYNLGDMLRENEEAFKLSYIENALTSNPILNKLITRSRNDVYTLIEAAETDGKDSLDLEGNYSMEEINEFITVIRRLFRIRDVVLDINMEYIRSAAQTDEYRTEPAFKLQGSYRNMNRIAERVIPVMNDEELESLIEGSYENDSQTLTTGAEANMLKWKEIAGRLNDEDKSRWEQIKSSFRKSKLVKGDDKVGQAILQLNEVSEGITGIKDVIADGLVKRTQAIEEKNRLNEQNKEKISGEEESYQKGLEQIKDTIRNGFGSLEKILKEVTSGNENITKTITETLAETMAKTPASASPLAGEDLKNIFADLKEVIASRPVVVSSGAPAVVPASSPPPGTPAASTAQYVTAAPAPQAQTAAAPPQTAPKTAPSKKTTHAPKKKTVAPKGTKGTESKTPAPPATGPEEAAMAETRREKLPDAPQTPDVPPEDLEVWVEPFRVISAEMAKRLARDTSALSQEGIRFGTDYSLINASLEGIGNRRVLLLIWECLKIPAGSEKEKIKITLIKEKTNIWETEVEFSDLKHVYIKGDIISGRVRLDNQLYRSADQIGIQIDKLPANGNNYHGLTVYSGRHVDNNGTRLLIDLEFRHKF